MLRILLIDDSADYRKLLIRYIKDTDSNIDVVEYDPVSERLPDENFPWDNYQLVILDYDFGLGRENGLGWMIHFDSIATMPPVIMLTTEKNKKLAVYALKAGAIDFIDKEDISIESISTTLDGIFTLTDKQHALIENNLSVENSDINAVVASSISEPLFQDEEHLFKPSDTSEKHAADNSQLEKFGLVVPGYELLGEIGCGGMSTVFLAKPIEEDTKVALKIMFTHGNEDPLALKRFMQEYTLISCLKHPNVVCIYERAFAADFAYIAMEHFPYGDLAKRLASKVELDTAIDYTRQMCKGLIAIHDLNIVHRDIKPGNFLFKEDGTLTIIDFGVAKDLTQDGDMTINNQVIGTPYYISPEQGYGMSFDHRSDLYSLGIIMYQMLTNKRPYTAKSIAELISMHHNAPIPKLPERLAKYQPLIDGLLAKDPDERFQSANDVILGLDWIQ